MRKWRERRSRQALALTTMTTVPLTAMTIRNKRLEETHANRG